MLATDTPFPEEGGVFKKRAQFWINPNFHPKPGSFITLRGVHIRKEDDNLHQQGTHDT